MSQLKFKEDSHQYFLPVNGMDTELISVSRVLQSAKIYNYGRTQTNIAAMNRGTHVHNLTHMIDIGTLVMEDIFDEAELGYVQAYEDWKKSCGFKLIMSEVPMYHRKYMYAGTPDRYGLMTIGGKVVAGLIDIKTGQPHPGNMLQLAAYREMLIDFNNNQVDIGMCVYLNKNGTYKVIPSVSHDEDYLIFLSALNVWRWKSRNNIKETQDALDPV